MKIPRKINKTEALRLMREAAKMKDDPEAAHGYADEILCALLEYLGCEDVVSAFEDVERWYA